MKKILFLTGTRADFGKIKSLISILEQQEGFEVFVFVTGMHMLEQYGYTVLEIERCCAHTAKGQNQQLNRPLPRLNSAVAVGSAQDNWRPLKSHSASVAAKLKQ